ncbi:MAG: hypothetical protein ACLP01_31795 [Solirubrobacteraceae bacterium]
MKHAINAAATIEPLQRICSRRERAKPANAAGTAISLRVVEGVVVAGAGSSRAIKLSVEEFTIALIEPAIGAREVSLLA